MISDLYVRFNDYFFLFITIILLFLATASLSGVFEAVSAYYSGVTVSDTMSNVGVSDGKSRGQKKIYIRILSCYTRITFPRQKRVLKFRQSTPWSSASAINIVRAEINMINIIASNKIYIYNI